MNKTLPVLILMVLLVVGTVAADTMLDEFDGDADDANGVYNCNSYANVAQPFNLSASVDAGDNISFELDLENSGDCTKGLLAQKINISIVAASAAGQPTGSPTVYANHVFRGDFFPQDDAGWMGKNGSLLVDSNMAVGWYVMIVKCEDCGGFPNERLCIARDDNSAYYGLTSYGLLEYSTVCNIWGSIDTDSTTNTWSGFRIYHVPAAGAPPADTTAPVYSNIITSGTNKTATIIQFNATWLDETALSGWKFEHNQTGTVTNSSFNTTFGSNNESSFNLLLTLPRAGSINWRFFANDTSNNWNLTDINTFEVINTQPATVTTFNTSSVYRVATNESLGWTAATDPDSDTVNYKVWWNNSGTVTLLTDSTDNNFSLNVGVEGTYTYWVGTNDGLEFGGNSSIQTLILDITAPIITWHSPAYLNITTSNATYLVNITCTDTNDLWSINITHFNGSDVQIASVYAENITGASANNYTTITLSTLQPNRILVRCYDSHTFGDDVLNYTYSDGTFNFYDRFIQTNNQNFLLGYAKNGVVHKVNPTQIVNLNINYFAKKYRNDYNFGAVFDMSNQLFDFAFKFPYNPNKMKLVDENTAHYIILNKYYVDFDAMVCKKENGEFIDCIYANPNIEYDGENVSIVYSLVDPWSDPPYSSDLRDYFDVGDRLVFYTKSIGALNYVEENRTIMHDDYPTYTNFTNNASQQTYLNGVVNWSVNASDQIGLYSYKFSHNLTGSWSTDSQQVIGGSPLSATLSRKLTISQSHAYVCAYFTINDTGGNLNVTNQSCMQTLNTLPPVPSLQTPVNKTTQYINLTVFNWATVVDSDGDTVTYTLMISNSSLFTFIEFNKSGIASSDYTLTTGESLPDGDHYWQVNASDGYDTSNYSKWFTYTINTSFGIAGQSVNCSTCYNNYAVAFNCSINGMIGTVWYGANHSGSWVNYTAGITNITSNYFISFGASNYDNQETVGWRWYANSSLGLLSGGALQTLFVSNRAPTHNTPILNSSDLLNLTTSNLTAHYVNISDIDGDTLRYHYNWYKDDVYQSALIDVSMVGSGNTTAGDQWKCQVRVSDDIDNSTARNSTVLLIKDIVLPNWNTHSNNASNVTSPPGKVNWSVTLTDNKALSHFIFSYNDTGTWETDAPVALSGNDTIASVVKTIYLSSAYICGNFTFNDTSDNWNSTNLSCFTTLADSTPSTKHLTFNSNATITYNLSIPMLYVNYSKITFTAYQADNYTNKPNPKEYGLSGSWVNNASAIDDDWTYTEYAYCGGGSVSNLTINYTMFPTDYNFKWEIESYTYFTNLSITSCDTSNNKLRFEIRSLFGYDDLSGTQWYCKDSTNAWLLLLNDSYSGAAPSKAGIREEQLWGTFRSYPTQINISLNNQEHYYNASEWNITSTPVTVTLNNTLINNILGDNCSCTDCTLRNNYCYLPLEIYSSKRGVLGVTSKNEGILLEIDNCSGNDAIPTNGTALNISFHDSNGTSIKISTYASAFNYRLDSNYTGAGSVSEVNVNQSVFCIYPSWARLTTTQQIEYYDGTNNYEYWIYNSLYSNTTKQVKLYTQEGTTQVTLTVKDSNDNDILNSYIKVQKYDVGTNSYTTVEIVRTNEDGQAITNLVLYTTWYKFIVEYNGWAYITTEPTKVFETTKNFVIDLSDDDWFVDYEATQEIDTSLTFNNETLNFKYEWNDHHGNMHYGCLKVEEWSAAGNTILQETCTESAAATLLGNVGTTGLDGKHFIATGYIKFDNPFITEILDQQFPGSEDLFHKKDGRDIGLFVSLITIVSIGMVGIWHPVIAIVLTLLGVFVTVSLRLWQLATPWLVAIIIMGGMIIFRIRDK